MPAAQEETMSSPVACVTGATGFVANELIKQLLERGYRIRATCRCPCDSPKVAAVRQLGAVELIQVPDILKPSKELDSAVHGAKYLFHLASPFRFDGDPVKDIVEPAVEGTKTVLEAASRSQPPVSRVVVTSSVCGECRRLAASSPTAAPVDFRCLQKALS